MSEKNTVTVAEFAIDTDAQRANNQFRFKAALLARSGGPTFETILANATVKKAPKGALLSPRGLFWQDEARAIAEALAGVEITASEARRWFETVDEAGHPAFVCVSSIATTSKALRDLDELVDAESAYDNIFANGAGAAFARKAERIDGTWDQEVGSRIKAIAMFAIVLEVTDDPAPVFMSDVMANMGQTTGNRVIDGLLAQLVEDEAEFTKTMKKAAIMVSQQAATDYQKRRSVN